MSNTNGGAVFAPYEAGADASQFAALEQNAEELEELKADGLRLSTFGFVVVMGRDADGPLYMTESGNVTQSLHGAATFDAWHDAERFMLDNAAFAGFPPPMRRGYERPAFPRVCYVRTYEEITVC